MVDHMGVSLLPARLAGSVLGGFGFVALVLGTMGVYGIMAYWVGLRRREMGVRVALGATPADLISMVILEGMRLAAIGILIGLVAAVVISRTIPSLLYGLRASDPATFGAILLILTGVALFASYLPARRATRVSVIEALRCE